MPIFEYKGITAKGKSRAGLIDADTIGDAKRKLRRDGIFPSQLHVATEERRMKVASRSIDFGQYFNHITTQQLSNATRILATLVNAHIPLVEALTALVDQLDHAKLKRIFSSIRDNVNEGSSLGNALEVHPKVFSNLYINMVKAGEVSGALDIVLNKLAELTEKQVKLRSKIVSSMAYPVLMSVVGLIILIILFTFVIPKILILIEDIDASLPLPTVILLGINNIVNDYWFVVLGVVGVAVYVFKRVTSTVEGRYRYHDYLLKLPIFGKLFRFLAISRFCNTLSTLLSSGVPLLTALTIVKNIVGNDVIKQVVENAVVSVSEGASISDPLKKSRQFPPIVTHMIMIGEKTGELERMLAKVSESYENEVESTVNAMTALIEPLMIVTMGAVVGFIVIAILLPIFQLQQMVG